MHSGLALSAPIYRDWAKDSGSLTAQ